MSPTTFIQMRKMRDDAVNLYLVGFMGTGKSTIGRRVAEELKMRFVDSDHAIEKKYRMAIPEIFEKHGEAHFRALEREFVDTGHPKRGMVVACGGGLVVQDGMLETLENKGIVVCLVASEETIIQRVSSNPNRPLLNVDDQRERIRKLIAEREPIYRKVNTQLMTDMRPVPSVVGHLARTYLHEAARFKNRSA
ncbi:MAG: shikimate kinase [Opitutales bacterium]